MANGNSDYATAIAAAATALHTRPNADQVQQVQRVARFTLTGLGSETTGQYHVLGPIGLNGVTIVPEACRIRFGGTGTVDFKLTLKKVSAAGTVTSISAASGNITALTSVVTLTAAAATTTDLGLEPTDELRLYFTTGSSTVAFPGTATIHPEIAYSVERS